jgi:RNA polymerase sigma factor (sigma-70 family)
VHVFSETPGISGLIKRLLSGDPRAADALITHVVGRMQVLARTTLRRYKRIQGVDVDDLVNVTVERLLPYLRGVPCEKAPQSPRHFMFLVARQMNRILIDLCNRCATESLESSHQEPLASGDSDPVEAIQWREFHEAIPKLPESLRQTFELLFYVKASHSEAAALLGVSKRTIGRRCGQIRRQLAGLVPDQ